VTKSGIITEVNLFSANASFQILVTESGMITEEPLAKTFPNQLINCQLNTKPTALQTKITHYLT